MSASGYGDSYDVSAPSHVTHVYSSWAECQGLSVFLLVDGPLDGKQLEENLLAVRKEVRLLERICWIEGAAHRRIT